VNDWKQKHRRQRETHDGSIEKFDSVPAFSRGERPRYSVRLVAKQVLFLSCTLNGYDTGLSSPSSTCMVQIKSGLTVSFEGELQNNNDVSDVVITTRGSFKAIIA
jgi:hypothetical protein